MARVEDMLHKMMRRFDASDEHIKDLRCDLASIGQKVDTHAILIKQIELQMAQLSVTVNTRQPGTLLSTLSKIQRMMRTVWQSLLRVVSKPLTHLCRLLRKM